MSRIFNRPMFKRGGSAGQGITSGLDRPGYGVGDRVTSEEILKSYGPAPRAGYNVFDFLTNWGLNMAGNPPSGNIFQTAAKQAQEPYAEFAKGKGEGALRDYAARVQATDRAQDINLKLDLADMANTGYKKYAVMPPRAVFVQDEQKNNMNVTGGSEIDLLKKMYPSGMAQWAGHVQYDSDRHDNISLAPLVPTENKQGFVVDLTKFANIENADKQIFWDPIDQEWFTVKFDGSKWTINETRKSKPSNDPAEDYGDTSLLELQNTISGTQDATIINNEVEVDETDSGKTDVEKDAIELGIEFDEIVPPRDNTRYSGKNWVGWYKRNVNPKAVTMDELKLLISKARHKLLVKRKQTSNTSRVNIKSSDSNVASTQ